MSKSGPNKASNVRVSLAEQAVTKSCVATESLIDAPETDTSVRCMGRNGKKSRVEQGCSVIQAARILSASRRRESANPGSPGKQTGRPAHYHSTTTLKLAVWVFFLLHSILFPLAQATWQTVRAHCDPEEGKSLTWRWGPGSSLGPGGPPALAGRLQRKRRERSVRSFGP